MKIYNKYTTQCIIHLNSYNTKKYIKSLQDKGDYKMGDLKYYGCLPKIFLLNYEYEKMHIYIKILLLY